MGKTCYNLNQSRDRLDSQHGPNFRNNSSDSNNNNKSDDNDKAMTTATTFFIFGKTGTYGFSYFQIKNCDRNEEIYLCYLKQDYSIISKARQAAFNYWEFSLLR